MLWQGGLYRDHGSGRNACKERVLPLWGTHQVAHHHCIAVAYKLLALVVAGHSGMQCGNKRTHPALVPFPHTRAAGNSLQPAGLSRAPQRAWKWLLAGWLFSIALLVLCPLVGTEHDCFKESCVKQGAIALSLVGTYFQKGGRNTTALL